MAFFVTCLRKLETFKLCHRYTKLFNPHKKTNKFYTDKAVSVIFNPDVQNSDEKLHSIQVSKYLQPFVNSSVEDILLKIEKTKIYPGDSVTLLKALRIQKMFRNINPNIFLEDIRFVILCNIFSSACKLMNPRLLISGLRSLLEVGVTSNSHYVSHAEEITLQKIFEFSMSELIGCLYFHQHHTHTDLQKQVVSSLVREIRERSYEIQTGAEILMLLNVFHRFDYDSKKKLESKIIELCKNLSMHELYKILLLLAEKSIRSKQIINAISQHMCEKLEKLDLKDVIDILYALKTLNYCDENLISYLLNMHISSLHLNKEPLLISRLLTACGLLKWRDSAVLDACGAWIINNIDICRTRELTAYIITVAALNYSSKTDHILNSILPLLSLEKVGSAEVWLNVVWSLAVLDKLDRNHLLEVFSKEVYQSLIDGSHFKAMTNKLKLMNLKGVMEQKFPECIFGCNLSLQPIEIPQSHEEKNYRRSVIKALSNFIPKEKYLCINQNTSAGIFIDAEFIFNIKGKPLPLHEYGVLAQTEKSLNPIPKDAKRFALIVLFYNNFTSHEQRLTGITALNLSLLTGKYDAVVKIPYEEFCREKTELEKVKYLLKNINELQ